MLKSIVKRLNDGICPSEFSSVYETPNTKFLVVVFDFWYTEFEEAIKTTQLVRRGKITRVMSMSGELTGTQDVDSPCRA